VSTLRTSLLATVVLLAVTAAPAAARTTYCSPSGDLCYRAQDKGAATKLRITLMAHYFTRYRLCVTAPGGVRDCRRFRVHRAAHGLYDSTVRWASHFPARGPGRYRASWRSGGAALGPSVRFAVGPSIEVRPKRVRAGRVVRVFGLAGGCPKGEEVALLSHAFPDAEEFAGVPAVFAEVDAHDGYSVRVRIPAGRTPARYSIGARCGGGSFGVERTLTVLAHN
jgi:hypothetical protein